MKQPTLHFRVGDKVYMFPVSSVRWGWDGKIISFSYYREGEGDYYFFSRDGKFMNIHNQLEAKITFYK